MTQSNRRSTLWRRVTPAAIACAVVSGLTVIALSYWLQSGSTTRGDLDVVTCPSANTFVKCIGLHESGESRVAAASLQLTEEHEPSSYALFLGGGPPGPSAEDLVATWPRWRPDSLPEDLGLIIVESPTAPRVEDITEQCDMFVRHFWSTLRDTQRSDAAELAATSVERHCLGESMGSPSHAEAASRVARIIDQLVPEDSSFGVVTVSFGATQWRELAAGGLGERASWQLEFGPVLPGDASELLERRSNRLARRLTRACKCTDVSFMAGLHALKEEISLPIDIEERSVPLTEGDLHLGMLRLGWEEDPIVEHITSNIHEWAELNDREKHRTLRTIADLSDAITRRYQVDSFDGASAASYWSEFCRSFNWTRTGESNSHDVHSRLASSLRASLRSVHLPCQTLADGHEDAQSQSRPSTTSSEAAGRTLVLIGEYDPLYFLGDSDHPPAVVTQASHNIAGSDSDCLSSLVNEFVREDVPSDLTLSFECISAS